MLDLGSAFRASPLWQELASIAFGNKPWPTSHAKRQHFVPRFVLSGFVKPGSQRLAQLSVRTGQAHQVLPHRAASRKRFYSLPEREKGEPGDLEAWLSIIESHSAEALRRFLTDPTALSHADRATLALFLALIHGRTPGGNAQHSALSSNIMRLLMTGALFSPEKFASDVRKAGRDRSPEESEAARLRLLAGLRDGSMDFVDPRAKGFEAVIRASGTLAQDIFASPWMMLRAPDRASLITSDAGLAMHDPSPFFPWSGQAWQSSPAAQVTIPLSREWLLMVMPPGDDLPLAFISAREMSKDEVTELNLRTYGWAHDHVFGPDQHTVTSVRAAARRNPHRVVRPKPMHQVLLIPADPEDPSLADANASRGWPRQLDQDGQAFDYLVLGPDDDVVAAAERFLKLAETRGAKGIQVRRTRRPVASES